jgi:hypothetical protein
MRLSEREYARPHCFGNFINSKPACTGRFALLIFSPSAQAMIAQFVKDIESFDEQWEQNPTHVNDKYQVRGAPPLCFILVKRAFSCRQGRRKSLISSTNMHPGLAQGAGQHQFSNGRRDSRH